MFKSSSKNAGKDFKGAAQQPAPKGQYGKIRSGLFVEPTSYKKFEPVELFNMFTNDAFFEKESLVGGKGHLKVARSNKIMDFIMEKRPERFNRNATEYEKMAICADILFTDVKTAILSVDNPGLTDEIIVIEKAVDSIIKQLEGISEVEKKIAPLNKERKELERKTTDFKGRQGSAGKRLEKVNNDLASLNQDRNRLIDQKDASLATLNPIFNVLGPGGTGKTVLTNNLAALYTMVGKYEAFTSIKKSQISGQSAIVGAGADEAGIVLNTLEEKKIFAHFDDIFKNNFGNGLSEYGQVLLSRMNNDQGEEGYPFAMSMNRPEFDLIRAQMGDGRGRFENEIVEYRPTTAGYYEFIENMILLRQNGFEVTSTDINNWKGMSIADIKSDISARQLIFMPRFNSGMGTDARSEVETAFKSRYCDPLSGENDSDPEDDRLAHNADGFRGTGKMIEPPSEDDKAGRKRRRTKSVNGDIATPLYTFIDKNRQAGEAEGLAEFISKIVNNNKLSDDFKKLACESAIRKTYEIRRSDIPNLQEHSKGEIHMAKLAYKNETRPQPSFDELLNIVEQDLGDRLSDVKAEQGAAMKKISEGFDVLKQLSNDNHLVPASDVA